MIIIICLCNNVCLTSNSNCSHFLFKTEMMLTILDTSTLRRLSAVSHKAVIIICQSLISYLYYSKFNSTSTSNSGGVGVCSATVSPSQRCLSHKVSNHAHNYVLQLICCSSFYIILSGVSRGMLRLFQQPPPCALN